MLKDIKKNMLIGLGTVVAATVPGAVAAEEIHVIATGALQGAMQKLKPAYEKKTGNKLIISWGPSFGKSPESIPERLRKKEPVDIAILTDESLVKLPDDIGLSKPSARVIAESRIGVGVPHGKPKPDISSGEAFTKALLAADRVAYSQGASGVFIGETLLPRLGVADQLRSKTVIAEGKELVGALLARGEADIGMQQVSELMVTPGVDYVGPLPESLQKVSRFVTVLAANGAHSKAARSFAKFLASAQAKPLLTASGLDPVTKVKAAK